MTSMSLKRQLLGLAGWLLLSFAVAALGAIASVNAASYYGSLAQPSWAPPAWVFGPVWSALYLMMGVAAWLVWRRGGWSTAPVALWLFVVQLALNALWSWLFFAWHQGALAFVDIVVLWLAIVATMVAFWRQRAWAGVLLLPYLGWVSFAALLCFTVWRLNPQAL